MKKSRTAGPSRVVESPTVRALPLVEVWVDTKTALFELMVAGGPPGTRRATRGGPHGVVRPAVCPSRGPPRLACGPRAAKSRCRPSRR